jgi:glycosyltransferase involved in cell wall biosynthesis
MAPYGLVTRQVYDGPVLIDFPDALSLYYQRMIENPRDGLAGIIDRIEVKRIPEYEKKLLQTTCEILVCSEVDRRFLLERSPGSTIHVLPHRVNTSEFHPRSREDGSPRLVFTGTLGYEPNVDALLYLASEILPQIEIQPGEVQVVGYGDDPRIAHLRRDDRYHFTGFVPSMAEHLFSDDIYLCPLRIAAGLRNKLLEAFAAGMPVISSTIGYEGIDCIPGEHLLVADTSEEFTAAIEHLRNCPEERKRLGENARKLAVENYSQEVFVQRINSLYKKIINGRVPS